MGRVSTLGVDRSLLRELLDAERNRKSEQLSKDQLTLFETLWKAVLS